LDARRRCENFGGTVAASNTWKTLRVMATKCLPPFASSGCGDRFKELDAPYRSGTSKTWIKVKNQTAPPAMRALYRTF